MNRFFLCSAIILTFASTAAFAAPDNPFFAMDTALKGAPQEFLKELAGLGFAGLSANSSTLNALASLTRERGLQLYATYFTATLDLNKPALETQPALKETIDHLSGKQTTLWLAISKVTEEGAPTKPGEVPGTLLPTRLLEITTYAAQRGVTISLYPHAGFFLQHVEQALQVTRKVAHPNLNLTFNLCHWLKVEGDVDPAPILKEALPHLGFVTLNGADAGDTKAMPWSRLIQVIGAGSYDLSPFLRSLHSIGYTGPIGLQHFGLQGDWKENLTQSMRAWQALP